MRSRAAARALALLALFLGGCEDPVTPRVCTAIAVDALNVTVLDAATGLRVCDARVSAIDGSFSVELRANPGPECSYSGPTERPGRYQVEATRSGYETAVVRDVAVTADECHVIPVALTVRLNKP